MRRLGPILLLSVFVIGGIYGGLFTPTEAGALGAAGAIVLTALMGVMSRTHRTDHSVPVPGFVPAQSDAMKEVE
ncbi:MAG: TRAP transporter large permease subunit [Pusillimonas sp.]|nr:TRAP transporter large permease subunit [Pusillimonas sp.]